MKKVLLACLLIAGSSFFVFAQFKVGDNTVNVGKVCATIDGKPVCINPQTGKFEAVGTLDGKTVKVGGNTNSIFGGSNTTGGAQGSSAGAVYNGSNPLIKLLVLAHNIAARLVPLLVALALLAFFWFLILFIWKGRDNPEEQKKMKSGMAYSILAIFVMVSVWGIIFFIGNILGIGQGGGIPGFRLPGE